jgi:hypothetical protein
MKHQRPDAEAQERGDYIHTLVGYRGQWVRR